MGTVDLIPPFYPHVTFLYPRVRLGMVNAAVTLSLLEEPALNTEILNLDVFRARVQFLQERCNSLD